MESRSTSNARKLLDATLFTAAQRRHAWQSAATQVSTLLLAGTDPQAILPVLTGHAVRLGGASAAAITVAFQDPTVLRVATGIGLLDPRLVGELIPLEGSVSQLALTTGAAIVVDDMAADPRTSSSAVRALGIGPAVAAPLGDDTLGDDTLGDDTLGDDTLGDDTLGDDTMDAVLLVARTTGEPPFPPSDVEMIASFAGHAGRALALAAAGRKRERRRLVADRELIATQLSEQAMQALLGISTAVHGLTARMQSRPDPDDAAQRLAEQADRLDAVLRQMQRTIFGLQLPTRTDTH